MQVGSDELKSGLREHNEQSGPVFKMRADPRITRVGRFLRRSSIDELPQFWNVLKGDMSLVGPRPPTPDEVTEYEPWQLRRLQLTPGITCLWQVSGRSEIGFVDWVRLDLRYAQHRTPGLDLALLAKTLPAVLSGRGAF
jgi:lipopolysaccharide/colanic/teichoic acid biosynthesis glycosyltransferase